MVGRMSTDLSEKDSTFSSGWELGVGDKGLGAGGFGAKRHEN